MSTNPPSLELENKDEVITDTLNVEATATATSAAKKRTSKHKNKMEPLVANLVVHTACASVEEDEISDVPPTPLVKDASYINAFTAELLNSPQAASTIAQETDFANNLSSPTPAISSDACPLITVTSSSPSSTSNPVAEASTDSSTAAPVALTRTALPSLTGEVALSMHHGTLVSSRVANSFLASLFDVCNSGGDETFVEQMQLDYLKAQEQIFAFILADARAAQDAAASKKKTIEINRARDAFKLKYSDYILPKFLNKAK